VIKKVQHYFRDKDLNMEKMSTVSKAGAGLLQWVIAIKDYYAVARDVEPLKKKVKDMEKQQTTSARELAEITEALAKLTAELADLDIKYKAASIELAQLQEKAAVMQRRLTAASKLIAGLSSERSRWSADVEKLQAQATRLVGDCLLSASFLSYLGPFTYDFRVELMQKDWAVDIGTRGVPVTSPFSVESLMTTEATVQKWVADGLPADAHSVMNGILTSQGSRFPLCIDPQQQAVTWIKNREKSDLRVATLMDGDFMQVRGFPPLPFETACAALPR
jgi:dynein heavy chain, axonemal